MTEENFAANLIKLSMSIITAADAGTVNNVLAPFSQSTLGTP